MSAPNLSRLLDRLGKAAEALRVECLFDHGEQLALLEADVIVQECPERLGVLQGRLGGFESQRLAPYREMLVEHAA